MKRIIIAAAVLILLFACSTKAEAKEIEALKNSVEELKDSIDDDTLERMTALGVNGADVSEASDISVTDTIGLLSETLAQTAARPLSSCAILIAVILLASLLESYTFSLRYVDTKDVMNAVTSLMIIAVLVTPVSQLIDDSLNAVRGTASLMLVYIPIMAGIMAFSGHIVRSGGYYATVMAASQGIAQLSGILFAPLLHIFLAISVSSAISERVKLSGICELISKVIKWALTFAMTIFTAILSVHGLAANAADSVASKTVRFTLSSFIPVIGSSVSEAYRTIRGSVDLLRSGAGVFVIIAVIVTYLPLILQIAMWQLAILAAKTAAETFSVTSTVTVLNSVSTVLSVLAAVIAAITAVFLISTGALIAVGGAS